MFNIASERAVCELREAAAGRKGGVGKGRAAGAGGDQRHGQGALDVPLALRAVQESARGGEARGGCARRVQCQQRGGDDGWRRGRQVRRQREDTRHSDALRVHRQRAQHQHPRLESRAPRCHRERHEPVVDQRVDGRLDAGRRDRTRPALHYRRGRLQRRWLQRVCAQVRKLLERGRRPLLWLCPQPTPGSHLRRFHQTGRETRA